MPIMNTYILIDITIGDLLRKSLVSSLILLIEILLELFLDALTTYIQSAGLLGMNVTYKQYATIHGFYA